MSPQSWVGGPGALGKIVAVYPSVKEANQALIPNGWKDGLVAADFPPFHHIRCLGDLEKEWKGRQIGYRLWPCDQSSGRGCSIPARPMSLGL